MSVKAASENINKIKAESKGFPDNRGARLANIRRALNADGSNKGQIYLLLFQKRHWRGHL